MSISTRSSVYSTWNASAQLCRGRKHKQPCPKAEMREIRTSGLMSGIWKRSLRATAPDLDSTIEKSCSCSFSSSFLFSILWTRGATKADFSAINLFARCHGGIFSFSSTSTSTSTTTRTSPLTSEFRFSVPCSRSRDKGLRRAQSSRLAESGQPRRRPCGVGNQSTAIINHREIGNATGRKYIMLQ